MTSRDTQDLTRSELRHPTHWQRPLEMLMFSPRWVIHDHKDTLLGFFPPSRVHHSCSCGTLVNTDLLMRLQSQDHQELLLFGRQSVSSDIFSHCWCKPPSQRAKKTVEIHQRCRAGGDLVCCTVSVTCPIKFWANIKDWQQPSNPLPSLKKTTKIQAFPGSRPAETLHPSSH